ncbi:MAG: aldo/keto reductase [Desulfobacterales bacterium]|nr:aldo/keto reductase [Desulfobacterales bacterium]
MQYRRLGRSGLQVSPLVLGTMNFGNPTEEEEAYAIVDAAVGAGINLIDCADIYNQGEAERILGEALKRNGRRHHVILTSKVYNRTGQGPNDQGNTRHHIIEGCEKSLKRLRTDYIDIYFLHRTDFNVPQEESLEALADLRQQGKIRYIACSTHPAWRTVEGLHLAERHGYPKFVCEQPPYNLLDRRIENEIVPMCRHYDLGIISWSPLAQGVLAGKYQDAEQLPEGSRASLRRVFRERVTPAGIAVGQQIVERAKAMACPASQLAVAWVLHQPGITGTIIGPRNVDQLNDLLPSLKVKLSSEDLAFFDELVPPGRYVTSFFNTAEWMKSKGI